MLVCLNDANDMLDDKLSDILDDKHNDMLDEQRFSGVCLYKLHDDKCPSLIMQCKQERWVSPVYVCRKASMLCMW